MKYDNKTYRGIIMKDRHHLLSRTKWALKKYGAKLLDDERNILMIDHDDHLNKPIPKYSERQFCEALDLMHCENCKQDIKTCTLTILNDAVDCRLFYFDLVKYIFKN
jgi:hypothetical protein